MKLPPIVDSALIVAVLSGFLYLLGFLHDSVELNTLGLPTSFIYPPQMLVLKGVSTLLRYAIIAVPVVVIAWIISRVFIRIKIPIPSTLAPKVQSAFNYLRSQQNFLIIVTGIGAAIFLFNMASLDGKEDARSLVQARTERATQITFKNGTQMVGVPFRSDDMFIVFLSRAQSTTGQMQALVRRREDISEMRTLQEVWAPPQASCR